MIAASQLAGFIAAHAIWCVSDADGLVPMVAYAGADGKRNLERMALDDLEAAIEAGRRRLESNPQNASDGVLAYDGRITIEGGKLDAIILEMRTYACPLAKAAIAVPYTPASTGRFLVHRPKLVLWDGCEDFETKACFEAFFCGIDSHEQGAKVWNAALDESR